MLAGVAPSPDAWVHASSTTAAGRSSVASRPPTETAAPTPRAARAPRDRSDVL
jgi:hypothetical protein